MDPSDRVIFGTAEGGGRWAFKLAAERWKEIRGRRKRKEDSKTHLPAFLPGLLHSSSFFPESDLPLRA